MTSRKQIEANRRNAQSSTGPKTPQGRVKSSANASKHGVLSERFLSNYEDQNLFNEMRDGLIGDFNPSSTLESLLIDRLAILFWRERRLAMAEFEKMGVMQSLPGGRLAGIAASPKSMPIMTQELFGRYQGMLGRQVRDTLRDLRDERERCLQTIDAADKTANAEASADIEMNAED